MVKSSVGAAFFSPVYRIDLASMEPASSQGDLGSGHYPGLLWADYNAGTNPAFAIGCFTVMVVAVAYIMGFLKVRSKSIWPCVLLHATHNTFVQGLYDALTAPVGTAKYITTEFGAGLAMMIICAAILLLKRELRAQACAMNITGNANAAA